MNVIYQGKQGWCTIIVTDASGAMVLFSAPERWQLKLVSRYAHVERAVFGGEDIEAAEGATLRFFMEDELTKSLTPGFYSLQIKANYAGDKAAIDIAFIEDFIQIKKGY